MDFFKPQGGSCLAPECLNIWADLQRTMVEYQADKPGDYCQKWDDVICGNYYPSVRTKPQNYVVTESIAKKVYEIMHGLVDSSYKVVSVKKTEATPKKDEEKGDSQKELQRQFDTRHWGMVGRYYNSCMDDLSGWQEVGDGVLLDLMEEVQRPFGKYDAMVQSTSGDRVDTFRPGTNTSQVVDPSDEPLVRQATVNLARYGIFPLVRYGVGASLRVPGKMRIVFAPQTQVGLPRDWMYRLKSVRRDYEIVLTVILKHLHGAHASRVQNFPQIAARIIDMETEIVKKMPGAKEWRDMRSPERYRNSRLPAFQKEVDWLDLNETFRAHWLDHEVGFDARLDGLFSSWLPKFGKIVKQVSKETMRSYFLWQTFLHTSHLWDMPWAKAWTEFKWKVTDYRPPAPNREEVCVGRVMRHFGNLVQSRMLHEVFPQKNGKTPYFRVDHVRARVKPPKGCQYHLPLSHMQDIYTGAQVHSGENDTSQWEDHQAMRVANLTRPERWTHLHDYFAMEKAHWDRSWRNANGTTAEVFCMHMGVTFEADHTRKPGS